MDLQINRHDAVPIFEQVREHLRQQIWQGQYADDQALPDERSLALKLGLSRMTVRKAIMGLTREGLLVRVRGKGTFLRKAHSSRPRTTNLPHLGIVANFTAANIRNSLFCHRILAGIQQASEQAGLSLAFREVTEPPQAFLESLKADTALKGVVLLEMTDLPLLSKLARLRIPAVLADSVQPDERVPAFDEVNHDCRPALQAAVGSLIRLGHRDIALLVNENMTKLHLQRREAYEAALRAHKLPVNPERIFAFSPSGETAYAITRSLLQNRPGPTAVVCAGGDELALGVLAGAQAEGCSVPKDLSIIGYGDTLAFSAPALSTVRVPWEQIGSTAIQVLLERLHDPQAPLKRVFLPCEYLPRGSCDTPPMNFRNPPAR
jgi:LacI family transcriptional regulator